MADMFVFATPKGELHKIKFPNGEVKFEIRWNPGFGPEITDKINTLQKFIDSEVLRLCDPKIPKDTGMLVNSGILNTQIGSGEVKYRTPYARRLYYHPEYNFSGEKNPDAGGYWFERMKQQHKEDILKGIRARIKEGMR